MGKNIFVIVFWKRIQRELRSVANSQLFALEMWTLEFAGNSEYCSLRDCCWIFTKVLTNYREHQLNPPFYEGGFGLRRSQ